MRLYHASKEEIRKPDVHFGRKNADFGQGFYLSPDMEFARRWSGEGFLINVYELELQGLRVRELRRNEEWFSYIFQNRRTRDTLEADVIIGPIANDTLYDTLGIISSGFLDPEDALELLMIGPAYTQVALKTPEAAACLTWLGAEKVQNPAKYREKLRQEETAYQEELSRCLKRLTEEE